MYSIIAGLVLFAVVCEVTRRCWRTTSRPPHYPPGPKWMPVVGNLFDMKRLTKCVGGGYQHKAFSYLSKLYRTSALGLKLGQELVVVVSGELVREVLTRKEFEGRPNCFFIKLRCMGRRRGITCTDGPVWQEQRSFVMRHLRKLGYGTQSMEDLLLAELSELKRRTSETEGQSVRLGPLMAGAVLNVLWTLVAGSRLSASHVYVEKILGLLERRTRSFDMSGGLLNHVPWLRFVAPRYTGYQLITDINRELKQLFQDVIADHKRTYDSQHTRDLIDSFIHEMKNSENNDQASTYTEDQLIMVCLDLFIAGSQTTSNTLDFAFLMVLLNPEIQKKVQEEIWSNFGKEHPPTLKDKAKLPYVEAVLMEVYRFCQVTPVSGPRRVLKDTTLENYKIPKDTSILLNLYSLHMDKEHWDQPDIFNPDRFLNSDGTLKSDDYLVPFGLGSRRCLGEVLARSCIFIFFTGLLQHFSIHPAPDQKSIDANPIPGMTMAPKPYYALLTSVEGAIKTSD